MNTSNHPAANPSPHTNLSPYLDWSSPIPMELVHKTHPESVYICSVTPIRRNVFALAARTGQLSLPSPDVLVLIEAMRQAGIAVAHIGYGVELGARFIVNEVSFHITDWGLAASDLPLIISMTGSHASYKRQELRHMRLHATLFRGSDLTNARKLAHGSGFLIVSPADAFERVERRLVDTVVGDGVEYRKLPHAIVGMDSDDRVMLAGTDSGGDTGRWRVVVDSSTFNHASHHLPGMQQLEVFRQAGLALVGADRRLAGVEIKFMKMVHWHAAMYCSASVGIGHGGRARVHVELTDQDAVVVAYGEMWYTKQD